MKESFGWLKCHWDEEEGKESWGLPTSGQILPRSTLTRHDTDIFDLHPYLELLELNREAGNFN